MKTIFPIVILAMSTATSHLAAAQESQKVLPARKVETIQDQIENDPAQQETERAREAAESKTVVKLTNPTHGWDSPVGQKFTTAIKYRRYKWADFDQVVFKSNVTPTDDMIELMSESPYAADIAYYLGKHAEEAAPITHMALAPAGAAIRSIEEKVKPGLPAN